MKRARGDNRGDKLLNGKLPPPGEGFLRFPLAEELLKNACDGVFPRLPVSVRIRPEGRESRGRRPKSGGGSP